MCAKVEEERKEGNLLTAPLIQAGWAHWLSNRALETWNNRTVWHDMARGTASGMARGTHFTGHGMGWGHGMTKARQGKAMSMPM